MCLLINAPRSAGRKTRVSVLPHCFPKWSFQFTLPVVVLEMIAPCPPRDLDCLFYVNISLTMW